ncbi:acyl-CoA dehydrogenase family protein [Mycobacteroides immunogenum]|uniref:Acyl-CoA dehydrogenase n=1 Tax=Mycobacteroides immunogenum TaxID=83262 RepID=A0A7V8LJX2_9MYCO|nr:acyl-CoA dehydrogenase family protein [Mycobacteroides immunogenum]AMT72318.1 acyl-CoA dehydrogenase [Mycobacteroides immunogenum]ANO05461.1 acyl-CoA dehydrogenase [Mycobacteroides immunogenum]KIU41624.1 acyl-CoA dehydrogenase [Mycobacteroides immunogenum]KPG02995.1 acyl-CoA dehydrogenase [Mycobacteroides immunogenum]KPG03071.1 acyl-CoA dehydrogenase [Mycobacteroides immunogenum]
MTAVLKPNFDSARRHFLFTEDHEALRRSIRGFLEREFVPHNQEWEENTFPDSVFTAMGKAGFLGINVPATYGGQGGDYYSALVLTEELSRACPVGVSTGIGVNTSLVMPVLNALGTDEQKQQFLPRACAGTVIFALGITEPEGGSDVASIRTRAVREESTGDYLITGSKMFISNGIRAHYILLLTKTDPDAGHHGFTLFLVDLSLPGVTKARALSKMGLRSSDTGLLSFDGVRVPATAVVGEVGKGFFHIMSELQAERLVMAAGAVAAAQAMFDKTLRYSSERKAFGKPIGKFQALRHKFAQMSTEIDAARQLTYATVLRFANGEYPVREISQAKLFASQVTWRVADECLQIHGGAGVMTEYEIERMWRDARINRIGGGTDEICLDLIGKSYGL